MGEKSFQASVDEVVKTLLEAVLLVVVVVILFLQTWRAAIIPILAIPVSLIGTFLVMSAAGISFNVLSLFGLVLSIGIVVDDAIVVVENVERHLANGLRPREARARAGPASPVAKLAARMLRRVSMAASPLVVLNPGCPPSIRPSPPTSPSRP